MSSLLEFRAWDVNEDEYISWDRLIHTRYNQDYLQSHEGKDAPILSFMTDKYLIKEQWIGRYDKNKVKIYVGDIVRAWVDLGPGGEMQCIFTVSVNPAWGCNLQQWTYEEEGYLPEVLGNIHENPELLKAKDD